MKNRKIYSSDLKTQVVLEMLREELTTSQIAAKSLSINNVFMTFHQMISTFSPANLEKNFIVG
jgi:hypothetical protein